MPQRFDLGPSGLLVLPGVTGQDVKAGVELANDSLGAGPAQDVRQETPDPLEVGGRRPGPEEIAAGVEEVELPSQLGAELLDPTNPEATAA